MRLGRKATILVLHNFSDSNQPHPIIAKYPLKNIVSTAFFILRRLIFYFWQESYLPDDYS